MPSRFPVPCRADEDAALAAVIGARGQIVRLLADDPEAQIFEQRHAA
jgi:hypothetical protein